MEESGLVVLAVILAATALLAGTAGVAVGLLLSRGRVQRERAEAAAGACSRLGAYLDGTYDAVAMLDRSGRVSMANDAFRALVRHEDGPVSRLTEEALDALGLPVDLPQQAAATLREGTVFSLSTALRQPDGGEVPVELRIVPSPDPALIALVIRDRRMEEALHKTLEREKERRAQDVAAHSAQVHQHHMELEHARREYSKLFDEAPFMVQTVDPYGYMVNCNKTMARTLGLEVDELIGRSLLDFIDPREEKAAREHLEKVRYGEELEAEFKLITQDGDERIVICRSSPAWDGGATCVGVRSVLHDVTAERQREELLQRATQALAEKNAILAVKSQEIMRINHSRSEFISSVSHELRTPLHAVIGYAELLGRGLYGELNERQQKSVDGIVNRGNDLLNLINNILDLSRIDAGRLHLEQTKYAPREVLEEIEQTALLLLQEAKTASMDDEDFDWLSQDEEESESEHHVEIRVNVGQAPHEVLGDRNRYKQVVLNLVSNAVRYTEDGHVDIVCRREDDGTFVTAVSDTGIGISPEDADAIFEPFYQVEASSTRIHGGTGLGLSIARRLTEQMGGRLTLSSRAGVGSTFYLRLPEVGPLPEEADLAETAEMGLRLPARQAPVVLVVGEESTGFVGVKAGLREEGLALIEEPGVRAGVEAARSQLPTAIVMLLQDASVNPADLVTMVRADPVTAHIPVVLVGPASMSSAVTELAVDEYITVPTDGVEVAERVWPLVGQAKRRMLIVGPGDELVDDVGQRLNTAGIAVARAQRGSRALDFLNRNAVPVVVACNDMPDITVFDLLAAIDAMEEEQRPAVVVLLREPVGTEERSRLSNRVVALFDPNDMQADEMARRIHELMDPDVDADGALTDSREVRTMRS